MPYQVVSNLSTLVPDLNSDKVKEIGRTKHLPGNCVVIRPIIEKIVKMYTQRETNRKTLIFCIIFIIRKNIILLTLLQFSSNNLLKVVSVMEEDPYFVILKEN